MYLDFQDMQKVNIILNSVFQWERVLPHFYFDVSCIQHYAPEDEPQTFVSQRKK